MLSRAPSPKSKVCYTLFSLVPRPSTSLCTPQYLCYMYIPYAKSVCGERGHLGTRLHFIRPFPSSLSITFTQYMVKDSYLIGRFRTNFFSCGGLALDGGVPPPPPHPNQPLYTNTIVADCTIQYVQGNL